MVRRAIATGAVSKAGTRKSRAGKRSARVLAALIAALALFGAADKGVREKGAVPFMEGVSLGVAVTPAHFPHHGHADLDQAFDLAATLGGHAVFIFQWSQYQPDVVKMLMKKCGEHGLEPIIALSPTTLDQGRGGMDAPLRVRMNAWPGLSFSNPAVRREFIKDAREIAANEPPLLCLATEINLLAFKNIEEYVSFAGLYKEAYKEVKKVSPRTRVFVSFQWDWANVLDEREPGEEKIREHGKLIGIFKPELDLIAFTSYPSTFFDSPTDLPDDYYTRINRHVDKSDQIIFMEMGWPTRGSGDEQEQAAFIRRLPALLAGLNVKVVAWPLLHDVSMKEFGADLNTTGLVASDGKIKPGFEAFKDLSGDVR